jgi:hypothetical protein
MNTTIEKQHSSSIDPKTHVISTSFINFKSFVLEDGIYTNFGPQLSDMVHIRDLFQDCFIVSNCSHLLKKHFKSIR